MKRFGMFGLMFVGLVAGVFLFSSCGGGGGGGDDSDLPRVTRVTINGVNVKDEVLAVCIGDLYNVEIYIENDTLDISGLYWDERFPDGSTLTYWFDMEDFWNYLQIPLIPGPPVGRYKETLRLQSLNGSTSYYFYVDLVSCYASLSSELNDSPRWYFENAIGDYVE